MRASLLAAVVLLTACSSGSTPAAATSSTTPSAASPSPVPTSFGVACRLPVTWYPSDAVPDGTNSFVALFDALTGTMSGTTARPALHFLNGGPSYDPVVGKWLPVPASAVAPDGLHYAYAEWDPAASGMAGGAHAANGPVIGTKGRVHLVDSRTGADSVVFSGEPTYAVAAFVAEGIVLSRFTASMAGTSYSGLYLLKLASGATPAFVMHSDYALDGRGWGVIDGDAAAWGTAWSNGVSGLGTGNLLVRFDLSTLAIATWLTVPEDHGIMLLGVIDHDPVVLTVKNVSTPGEPIDARVLVLTAPNQTKQLMATDGFSDPLPGLAVQDGARVWFGGGGGTIWLYDGSSMRFVRLRASDSIVDVGGPCLKTA